MDPQPSPVPGYSNFCHDLGSFAEEKQLYAQDAQQTNGAVAVVEFTH